MRKSINSFRHVLAEYGVVALVLHYVIFGLVLGGAWLAMRAGWQPSSRIAGVGTWAAAYLVTKITQPVRIILTVALTPFVARGYERVTGRRPRGLGEPTGDGDADRGGRAGNAAAAESSEIG